MIHVKGSPGLAQRLVARRVESRDEALQAFTMGAQRPEVFGHHVERAAELVGDSRRELSEARHLLVLDELGLRGGELFEHVEELGVLLAELLMAPGQLGGALGHARLEAVAQVASSPLSRWISARWSSSRRRRFQEPTIWRHFWTISHRVKGLAM